MKRASILIVVTLFVCLMASASVVQAGGFALYEYSNRGIAMATVGYAHYGDASVLATNPSLMTRHEGGEVYAGFAAITPTSDINFNDVRYKTKQKTHIVPHAYYTQQVTDNVWLGVGMFTRYGLGTSYDDTWAGAADLIYVNLNSVSLTPTVAFKFNDKFSMGVGVELVKGGMQLHKTGFGLNTNGWAAGANLSFSYQMTDELSAGFTYRSPMKFFASGSGFHAALGYTNNNQNVEATLPSSYTLGIAYQPTEDFTLELDTVYTRWSLTDKMEFTGLVNTVDYLDYKDVWRFQLGAEYWATDWLAVRGGYVYDVTPTVSHEASFMLPANDRQLFSGGLGFKVSDFKIDWSLMYVITKERYGVPASGAGDDVDFVNGKTWISGLSVGYEF